MKNKLHVPFICAVFVLINSMTAHADMYYQKLLQEGWTPPTHENMDIAEKRDSIFGVWRRGSEANTTGEKEFGDYRPEDADNSHKDNWWYDAYYGGRVNGGSGRIPANAWRWIDEDKEGNRDGILNLYYFDSYWMVSNRDVDGKQLNEDGAWVVDGIVQTISERRDVKGNSEKCGLTPGLYWDRNHEGRIEISEDKKVRYYDGNSKLIMEGNVLDTRTDKDYPTMFSYDIEPTFDAVFDEDPFENKAVRYLSIYVDGGVDYSGRGYSSYGDICVVNGYRYGVFNRETDRDRDRLFSYEGPLR